MPYKNSKLIENQIKQLVEEMRFELSGKPAHIDTEMLTDSGNEIAELQHQLWKIESGE